ncbi:MAG: B12-binding domain-containing radical SAM protein, partial [Burkholderiaceae bacterium]
FDNFMALSDWLYAKTDATHRIALERLAALVTEWLCSRGANLDTVTATVSSDYAGQTGKTHKKSKVNPSEKTEATLLQRQARHLAA